jgi:uncharacterized membrane protein
MLPENRRAIWCLITFAHLVTVFCIIWFFIGHIWFISQFVTCVGGFGYRCNLKMHVFTIIMVVVQYIVGMWMIYCRIWNDSETLRYLRKKIQHRLEQFPDNDKCLDKRDTIACQKNVHNDANVKQPFMTI